MFVYSHHGGDPDINPHPHQPLVCGLHHWTLGRGEGEGCLYLKRPTALIEHESFWSGKFFGPVLHADQLSPVHLFPRSVLTNTYIVSSSSDIQRVSDLFGLLLNQTPVVLPSSQMSRYFSKQIQFLSQEKFCAIYEKKNASCCLNRHLFTMY